MTMWMPMLAMLAACTPEVLEDALDDTGQPPFSPDLPTGGCTLPHYDWAPMERMGEVVAWEELPELAFPAAAISTLLEMYGATNFPVENGVRVWRLRYITQDRGAEVESTMLIAMPDEDGTFPATLWAHGTTGFTDACAPSGLGLEGAGIPMLLAATGLAVAAPDYLGMNGWGEPAGMLHPYLVPEATAVASLDSMRAMLRFQEEQGLTVRADPSRTVLWGGSEGGFAALWADRYGSGYAPELDILATVALVPPTDLTGLVHYGLDVPGPTTMGLAAVVATQHQWYQVDEPLSSILTDEPPGYIASNIQDEMAEQCRSFPSVSHVESVEDVFQEDVIQAAADGRWDEVGPYACMMAQGDIHTSALARGSEAPVLVVLSEEDDLVVADVVRESLPPMCDQGYVIEHLECEGAAHSEGAVQTLPVQVQWVRARLAGDPLEAPCLITEPMDCSDIL